MFDPANCSNSFFWIQIWLKISLTWASIFWNLEERNSLTSHFSFEMHSTSSAFLPWLLICQQYSNTFAANQIFPSFASRSCMISTTDLDVSSLRSHVPTSLTRSQESRQWARSAIGWPAQEYLHKASLCLPILFRRCSVGRSSWSILKRKDLVAGEKHGILYAAQISSQFASVYMRSTLQTAKFGFLSVALDRKKWYHCLTDMFKMLCPVLYAPLIFLKKSML